MSQTSADAASARAIELFLADDDCCTCGHNYECIKNEDKECCTCVCGDGPGGCAGCGTIHCCFVGSCRPLEKCNPGAQPNICYCSK